MSIPIVTWYNFLDLISNCFLDVLKIETFEKIKTDQKNEADALGKKVIQKFKCTVCDTVYSSNDDLILHVAENHNFLDNFVYNGMKCSKCDQDFSQFLFHVETAKVRLL